MTATTFPGSVLLQNRLCYGVSRNVTGVPNGTQQTTDRPLSFKIDLLVVAA
jgi:hypothetical protein